MKPLTLQFRETPTASEGADFSQIEYDAKLNLSIDKATGRPAVEGLELLGTETNTRVTGEASDADPSRSSGIGILMATETFTKSGEGVDSDHRGAGGLMMETATTTMVGSEGTDSDKQPRADRDLAAV